jgi:hypothetical protein
MLSTNEVEEGLKEFLFLAGTKLAFSYAAVVYLCNYLRATFNASESIDKGKDKESFVETCKGEWERVNICSKVLLMCNADNETAWNLR